MKEKKWRVYSLQLPPGQARPGQKTAFLDKNAMKFCQAFNQETKELESWKILSVKIMINKKKEYKFTIQGQITSELIKKASDEKKVVSEEEIEKIAREKLPYLNTDDLEKAKKIVAGTIRSFNGVKIN